MTRAATIALACVVTFAWLWNPGHAPRYDNADGGYPDFRAEVYGGAPKGICYRILVPYIARAAHLASPPLDQMANLIPMRYMRLDQDMMTAHVAVAGISFAGYLALGWFAGPLALLLAWAAIGPHGGLGDPVTLGAFALGVWALEKRQARAFWLAFVIAALNRETAPLLLVWWCLSGRSIRAAVAALGFWCIMRGLLGLAYADNSMEMCWPMLAHNIKSITPLSATSLFAFSGAWLLIVRGMRTMQDWERRGLVIGFVALTSMAILWSRPERLRSYLELVPLAALAIERGINICLDRSATKHDC